jgi:DNA invertase Pin-like site-specific DNA recombinase
MRLGYIRVSTVEQNADRQLHGIELDRVFTDRASGKDALRPQLDLLLKIVRSGDLIFVHSMDRLARNLDDLRRIVKLLTSEGAQLHFIKEAMVFSGDSTPIANLMLSMMGAFAEFERALIRERQREGIELAKKRGAYRGGQQKLSQEEVARLTSDAALGIPKARLAKKFGISRGAVYLYLGRVK